MLCYLNYLELCSKESSVIKINEYADKTDKEYCGKELFRLSNIVKSRKRGYMLILLKVLRDEKDAIVCL